MPVCSSILQVYNLIPSSPAVATFIQSLAPLNSAANPLIYCLFSANLGKCLQRLWCRRHCPCCSTPEDDLLGSAPSAPPPQDPPCSQATRAVLSLDLRYTLPDMETTLPDTERRTRLLNHRSAQHR